MGEESKKTIQKSQSSALRNGATKRDGKKSWKKGKQGLMLETQSESSTNQTYRVRWSLSVWGKVGEEMTVGPANGGKLFSKLTRLSCLNVKTNLL